MNCKNRTRAGAALWQGAVALIAGLATGAAAAVGTNRALGRPGKVFSSHEGDGWSVSKLTDGLLVLDVTLPANTTATVFVPAKDAASVTESGKPANSAKGLEFLRMEDNRAVYAFGSGTYRFQSTPPGNVR